MSPNLHSFDSRLKGDGSKSLDAVHSNDSISRASKQYLKDVFETKISYLHSQNCFPFKMNEPPVTERAREHQVGLRRLQAF